MFSFEYCFITGNGWVGWRKESFPQNFVELIFELDSIRNLSAVHIFTNNFFRKNVQVKLFYIALKTLHINFSLLI